MMILELWVLFFIVYIGAVWVTILHRLKKIEKSLKQYDSENSTPCKTR